MRNHPWVDRRTFHSCPGKRPVTALNCPLQFSVEWSEGNRKKQDAQEIIYTYIYICIYMYDV